MRVVFLGNHTVGCRVLEVLGAMSTVAGVVAHPPDPEDGVRYLSVYDYASHQGWPVIRATGRSPELAQFITKAQPDLLWITDYRYLLPAELVSLSPLGAVNLHPSLLPRYRGRASVNWAILNGETELGLTAHFVDAGMDSGDIIEQVSYSLRPDQDVGDALEILYPLYAEITRRVLTAFRDNSLQRRVQDEKLASAFPRRRPEDGLIEWTRPAGEIVNLIRAVADPYPGAFSFADGEKVMFWKARPVASSKTAPPGMILSVAPNRDLLIACGQGTIQVARWTAPTGADVRAGVQFESVGQVVEPA